MSERKYINPTFPHFMHGGDYNPEQWIDTKEIWDDDMRLMKEANCNEMTVGIFSWSKLEPREGEYDFSFLDEIIEKIHKNGGKVVLATPSGARPHWLADKYPEVLRVNAQGDKMHYNARHNHCYTSPVYREKVRKINTLLAERYAHHPAVVAWHISNEYGGECYCPLCEKAFREYLRKKYDNDIKKLNFAYWTTFWSHTYDSFEQIEAPTFLAERGLRALNMDWRRFVSDQTIDFMKAEIEPLKKVNPNLPVTTNMMPGFYDLNYGDFAEHIDVASWDSYPEWHAPYDHHYTAAKFTAMWHDFFRSLKDRPHMLMESAPGTVQWKPFNKLKRPGMDVLAALQTVAHGGDTVQYFQFRKGRGGVEKFHGAVVDHIGTNETRVFKEVQNTGALLQKIDEVAGSSVKAKVAVVFDWENMWAIDQSSGFQNQNKKYRETVEAYYAALWENNVSVDVIGTKKDFSKYDLVIAPMLYMTDDRIIDKLETYVKNGGTLYTTYMLGMIDDTDLCHLGGFPGGKLKEVFGIWNEEIDTLYPDDRGEVKSACGKVFEAVDYCELIHARGAKVLAEYSKDFYKGMPALTVNEYGKGKAYYQAFRDTGDFKKQIITKILADLKIEKNIPDGAPEGVAAHKRYAENATYLFVENYRSDEVVGINLGGEYQDMVTGEKTDKADLPAYGIRVFKRVE